MSDMKGVFAGLLKKPSILFCAYTSCPDSFATWVNTGFYI